MSLFAMKNTYVVISSAGPNRDSSKGTCEQPFWDEHAAFIDRLVADGFILMGGHFVDEGGSLSIFNVEDEKRTSREIEGRSMVNARRSQTGKHQALANLYWPEEVTSGARQLAGGHLFHAVESLL
jgi:hypothetical protein